MYTTNATIQHLATYCIATNLIIIIIMIMITENIVTNWYVQEWKNYKSHRRVSYNLSKNNCKEWDLIVSVGKLFQSQIDFG